MTFSYSGDPNDGGVDEVRFLIQDTNSSAPLLSNEEIQYLYDKWYPKYPSTYYVAAAACDVVAAKYAGEVSYSADGVSVSGNELQQKYCDLATTMRNQYKSEQFATSVPAGGMLYGEDYEPDIKPLVWAKGMNDNLRAGQQEYGGTRPDAERIPEIYGTY